MNAELSGDKAPGMNSGNGDGRRVNLWRVARWSAPGLLLLVPLIAMQFSEQWQWGVFDFLVIGAILYGAVYAYELIAKIGTSTANRAAVGIALTTAIVLLWVNGAVGIIGDGPVNLLYFVVLAVGFFGALLAHFQPLGMARVLFAMAVAQMLVPVIALVIWKAGGQDLLVDPNSPHPPFDPGIAPVFILNGVFAALFAGAALLFRRAARGWAELRPA